MTEWKHPVQIPPHHRQQTSDVLQENVQYRFAVSVHRDVYKRQPLCLSYYFCQFTGSSLFHPGTSQFPLPFLFPAALFLLFLVPVSYTHLTLLRTTGTNIFGRRIEDDTITKASALLCTYLFAGLAATLAICGIDVYKRQIS